VDPGAARGGIALFHAHRRAGGWVGPVAIVVAAVIVLLVRRHAALLLPAIGALIAAIGFADATADLARRRAGARAPDRSGARRGRIVEIDPRPEGYASSIGPRSVEGSTPAPALRLRIKVTRGGDDLLPGEFVGLRAILYPRPPAPAMPGAMISSAARSSTGSAASASRSRRACHRVITRSGATTPSPLIAACRRGTPASERPRPFLRRIAQRQARNEREGRAGERRVRTIPMQPAMTRIWRSSHRGRRASTFRDGMRLAGDDGAAYAAVRPEAARMRCSSALRSARWRFCTDGQTSGPRAVDGATEADGRRAGRRTRGAWKS